MTLDPRRTAWIRTTERAEATAHPATLRVGVAGLDAAEIVHLTAGELAAGGTIDVTLSTSPHPVAVEVAGADRKALPPPALVGRHLVAPIVRMPAGTLALDIDEATRPLAAAWAPSPSDTRLARVTDGLELFVDLPFVGLASPAHDHSYALELDLEGEGPLVTVPATLTPGPGVIGVLHARLPPVDASPGLTPGQRYVMLLRTGRRNHRLGLDLVLAADGAAFVRRSTKVSIIVPLGPADDHAREFLGKSIGSAAAQAPLATDELEVLVVPEGTDTLPDGLVTWLGQLHPRLRICHREGIDDPRNVGLAAAGGEYVFFLDLADRLGRDTLPRLYDQARTCDADVALGRTTDVGSAGFRGAAGSTGSRATLAPRTPPDDHTTVYDRTTLYDRTHPFETLTDTLLAESLTPHQLYRRAFLDEHDLRFETSAGSEAMVDQLFVTEAYLLAERISVYADEICYYRTDRGAGCRQPAGTPQPAEHVAALRKAIALIGKYVEPGPVSDRFLRHWYATEVVHRLRGSALLNLRESDRQEWFGELRQLADALATAGAGDVVTEFAPLDRITADLLRAGRLDVLVRLASWEVAVTAVADVRRMQWEQQILQLGLQVRLQAGGAPVFASTEHRVLLDPPLSATGWSALTPAAGRAVVDVTELLVGARVDLILQQEAPEGAGTRYVVPTETRYEAGSFEVDLAMPTTTAADGQPLAAGRWSLHVRVDCCGLIREAPLIADRPTLMAQHPGRRLHLGLSSEAEQAPAPLALDIARDRSRPVVVRCSDRPRKPASRHPFRIMRILGS